MGQHYLLPALLILYSLLERKCHSVLVSSCLVSSAAGFSFNWWVWELQTSSWADLQAVDPDVVASEVEFLDLRNPPDDSTGSEVDLLHSRRDLFENYFLIFFSFL